MMPRVTLTVRDIAVVLAVSRYYVLNRPMVQLLCFPGDRQGRITRKRLQLLVRAGYLARHTLFVEHGGSPAPVYYATRKAAELLAAHFEDERFLAVNTDCPQPHLLYHWLAISATHLTLDAAIAQQSGVQLAAWYNEWEVVNKEETAPEKRFRIYVLLQERPRLVAAPDAAFLLSKDGWTKLFFLEQDRSTSGVQRLAAQKTPGYATLAERQLHLKLFPEANVPGFTVLMVTSTVQRREQLRRAFRGKNGERLWKFAAQSDLTPETFLSGPIFYPCEGDPVPLVKPDTTIPQDKGTQTQSAVAPGLTESRMPRGEGS